MNPIVRLTGLVALVALPVSARAQSANSLFEAAIETALIAGAIANPPDFGEVKPLVVAAGNITLPPYSAGNTTNRGNGYDGVVSLQLNRTDGTFICSGSLLAGGQYILTAAHCLANSDVSNKTNSVFVNFFPGPTGNTNQVSMTATGWYVKQGFGITPDPGIDKDDLAIISLPSLAPSGATGYSLYAGNAVGQVFDFAGFGNTASFGAGTSSGASFTARNQAFNFFDFDLGVIEPAHSGVLMADFDNGVEANDANCYWWGFCQFFGPPGGPFVRGVPGEGNTAGGDSGGPAFITVGSQKFIAGVTSFGANFETSLGVATADIDNNLNSSFGESAGWVRPTINLALYNHFGTVDPWFNQPPPETTTPEPGSLALFATGLAVFVAARHRRRRAA